MAGLAAVLALLFGFGSCAAPRSEVSEPVAPVEASVEPSPR